MILHFANKFVSLLQYIETLYFQQYRLFIFIHHIFIVIMKIFIFPNCCSKQQNVYRPRYLFSLIVTSTTFAFAF